MRRRGTAGASSGVRRAACDGGSRRTRVAGRSCEWRCEWASAEEMATVMAGRGREEGRGDVPAAA
eukprot:5170705-Prymnesium_polylepis.1